MNQRYLNESTVFLGQVGNSALESCVVVGGNLVGHIVTPIVVIVVIVVWSAYEGTIQGLWVGRRVILLSVSAGGGHGAWAGAGPVMRPQRGVVAKPHNIAPTSVPKNVSNLSVNKFVALGCLVAHIGQLKAECCIIRKLSIDRTTHNNFIPEHRDGHCCRHAC